MLVLLVLATLVLCQPAVLGQSSCGCKFPDQLSGTINMDYNFGDESSQLTAYAHFSVNYKLARVHLVPYVAGRGNVSEIVIDLTKGKLYVWLKTERCSIINADQVTFPHCIPLANTTVMDGFLIGKQFIQKTADGFFFTGTYRPSKNDACLPMALSRYPQSDDGILEFRRWYFEDLREHVVKQDTSKFFPKTDNCVETKSFNFVMI